MTRYLLAVPGADRRLQVVDEVVEIDLGLDPVGHFRGQALAADVALERRAHLDDVEVDRAGRDRLLQARIVVGLGEIDPGDLGTGIGLPRLQEAAEQEVVEVLVVEPHEGELDAVELAFLDVLLGRAEAQLADLLPIGVGRLALADSGNLEKLRAQIIGGKCRRQHAECTGRTQRSERSSGSPRPSGRRAGCAAWQRVGRRYLLSWKFLPVFVFFYWPSRLPTHSLRGRPLESH